MVRVLDATKDASEELTLDEFLERCVEYFEDGCVIDQPSQARLSEGVVRCYMACGRCAGFGHQKVKATHRMRAPRPDRGCPVDYPLKIQRKNSGWHDDAIPESGSFCQKSFFDLRA